MLKEEREKWVEIRKNDKKPTLLDECGLKGRAHYEIE